MGHGLSSGGFRSCGCNRSGGTGREVGRSRRGNVSLDRSSVSAGATGVAAASVAAGNFAAIVVARINDLVATLLEGPLGLPPDPPVAVAQRTCQSGNNVLAAAARVLAEFIANFIGSLGTHALVSVVQSVSEGTHEFRVTDAVEGPTHLTDGTTTLTGIAGGLRLVDQLRQNAGVITASIITTSDITAIVAAVDIAAIVAAASVTTTGIAATIAAACVTAIVAAA